MLSVLSVHLSTRISQKQHNQTSRNFLYMLAVAVAQSSSDDNAIYHVDDVMLTPGVKS